MAVVLLPRPVVHVNNINWYKKESLSTIVERLSFIYGFAGL
jgi:hypothetical protein